jgi:hypothetical protein
MMGDQVMAQVCFVSGGRRGGASVSSAANCAKGRGEQANNQQKCGQLRSDQFAGVTHGFRHTQGTLHRLGPAVKSTAGNVIRWIV